jgi:hypothetical protein
MRYTPLIGTQDDSVQYQSIKPTYAPCHQCGKKGKRKQVNTRAVAHVAALHRRSWSVAAFGVYQARCVGVRNTVANALIRDRMPYLLVIRRRPEDYLLSLSRGTIRPPKSRMRFSAMTEGVTVMSSPYPQLGQRLSITRCSWPGGSAHPPSPAKRGRTAAGSPRLLPWYWERT